MADDVRLFTMGDLHEGAEIEATPGQAHYLVSVMRRAQGAGIRLFNGRQGEWQARLGATRRDRAVMLVTTLLRPQAQEADLWLAFSPLKRDATDLVVQKATELGASALLPVFAARTNAGRVNLERARAIAVEAAEQCERLTVPDIRAPVAFFEFLADWPAARRLAACIERASPNPTPAGAGALLVGPEGGFAPAERDALLAAPFATPFWLGPLVLRAETACLAGLVLLQARRHPP